MKLIPILLLALILATVNPVKCEYLKFHCGIGGDSRLLAFLAAWPSSHLRAINTCCLYHYVSVERKTIRRIMSDKLFCQCLARIPSWYAATIIGPLFCKIVNTYSALFYSTNDD